MSLTKDKKPVSKTVKNPSGTSNKSSKAKWWLEDDGVIYKSVFNIVDRLTANQAVRNNNCLKYARLYQNLDLIGFANGFYGREASTVATNINNISYNIVKSCVDSAAAKIAKEKPKIQFLTQEGDYTLETKAKNLTQYVSGLFDLTKAYQKCQRLFVDACVWGTGCGYVHYTDDGNIFFDRVFIQELTIDDMDAIYGKPSSIHRTQLVNRDVLKERFPKFKREIDEATSRPTQTGQDLVDTDQIRLIESWHIKSGSKASDGKYTICIDKATLYAEEYTKDRFPFVFFNWSDSLIGFWGTSLASELARIQIEINKLLRLVSVAQDRMSNPIIFLENGSKISKDHLAFNEIAKIINYTGTPPTFATPSAIAPEIYAHIETLKTNAYQISGISQLSASSKKPEGIESGVALREFTDIESERFVLCGQRYEELFIDLAKLMIDVSRDLYADDKELSIKVNGGKFISTINWGDVDLDDDEYLMKAFPISMLPSTPSGKLETVQNLIQAGYIPQSYGLSLLNFPDLEEFTSLSTAALETTKMLIDKMLNDGVYTPPDPYLDLNLAMQLAHTTYLRSLQKKGIKPENLDLLRTFMQDILTIQAAAAPPPSEPTAGLNGVPQAQGVAAPVSGLVPQQAPSGAHA